MRIKPQPHRPDDDDKKSKGTDHHHKHEKKEKEFKLPKHGKAEAQISQQQHSSQIEGDVKAGEVKGKSVESAQQVDNVRQAILKMVDSMRIGEVGGKQLLNAQLKNDESIHTSLRGAEVRLEMSSEGLKVQIQPTAGQQDAAQALIAEHHDQVVKLQESLAAKNINLQQLQIGDHVVDLPHTRIPSPNELFSGQQLDKGDREGKGDGPPERIDPTEKN